MSAPVYCYQCDTYQKNRRACKCEKCGSDELVTEHDHWEPKDEQDY